MTQNAIAYLNLVELNRSNLAQERETNRANVAREEETNRANIAKETETNRSNLANEAETKRHNIISEVNTANYNTILNNHYVRQDIEQNRANMAQERVSQLAQLETQRSNLAREAEQSRANTINYMIATRNSDIESRRVDNDYTIKLQQLALDTHRLKLDSAKVGIEQRKVEVNAQDVSNRYELGWLNYGISAGQLQINKDNAENQKRRWESQSSIERQRALTDYLGTTAAAANNYSQAALAAVRAQTAPIDSVMNGLRGAATLYSGNPTTVPPAIGGK